jgi:neutral ceramidase
VKTALKITALTAFSISLILISFIDKIDRTAYQEMSYYKDWKKSIAYLELANTLEPDSLLVGWAKVNMTPDSPIPMAGYGKRKGASYIDVHDSVFVRTIFIENNGNKVAIVSADLLIIPPTVSRIVKSRLAEVGLNEDQIYYGATHSHSSLGAWYNTLVGRLFAGKYDSKVEQLIAESIIKSIQLAQVKTAKASLSFEKDLDKHDIKNRLIKGGKVEPYIRTLVFKTENKKAILSTYAAHSTILNAATLSLSRDFPGVLVDSLETYAADFAIYLAGTVGSMGPIENGETDFDEVNNQAKGVLHELLSVNEMESFESNPSIYSFQIPIPLRKASPRISKNLALRPWVFNWLFGESPAYAKVLKIGHTLMVGLPCDFSGELMEALDAYASSKGLNLIITSFNGTYAGYITADEHFDYEAYETITMSWFGPYNGAYFSEVVSDIIDKVAN